MYLSYRLQIWYTALYEQYVGVAELEPGQNNRPATRPDPVAIDPVTH